MFGIFYLNQSISFSLESSSLVNNGGGENFKLTDVVVAVLLVSFDLFNLNF
jgi:hypothetical protein